MHILEGRGIREGDTFYNHRISVIVTQALAKMLGNGSAVSKSIWFQGDTANKATVVGVVNDIVYGDMYGKPDPVMFFFGPPQNASILYVRLREGKDPGQALEKMEAVMKKDNPGYPFVYQFVDEQFNRMFANEMLMSKLSRIFSALAILISSLGLFGLAAYMAERRTKEIGIRKVLGASTTGLAALLSKDFLQLVVLSCLIAFPLAGWMMHKWLQAYAYRIDINAWVFVMAGSIALLIALATVSFQAIRTALLNPAKTLRSE